MPWRWAAAITSSPFLASISRPLTVIATASGRGGGGGSESDMGRLRVRHERAGRGDVVLELVPEPSEGGRDRRHGGRPQRADRGLAGRPGDAGTDVVAHVAQEVEVLRAPVAVDDAAQDALEPRRALTAGRALA